MVLAVTPGEPAGIGPDLVVAAAQHSRSEPWIVVGSGQVLIARAERLGVPLRINHNLREPTAAAGELTVLDVPLPQPVVPGILSVGNAAATLEALNAAVKGVLGGRFSGLVTGPMQKSVINDAGIPFTGHTEFLLEKSAVEDVVMLLVADKLRVALATTHLPLRAVADALSVELLVRRSKILVADLVSKFGIQRPRIALTGLNPHAGERGHLGREEIDIIEPACRALLQAGIAVAGPLPADTLFTPARLANVDAVLAMYHDQGLPVLKYAGFGSAVNVTLGLPFVRTSVDHGTALDIAGTGKADSGSFTAALTLAWQLTRSGVHDRQAVIKQDSNAAS